MTTTFTNQAATMVQNYDLGGAFFALRRGSLILFPTDTIWSVGCDACNPEAIQRLQELCCRTTPGHMEVLVSSIGMLKNHVAHLHPRIETLLVYHTRPLTVLFEEGCNLPPIALEDDGGVAIRLVRDEYCRQLIGAFGGPLAVMPACVNQQPIPTHFGAISSEILQGVDYVSKYRQHERNPGELPVMVKLLEGDEELLFIRE